MIFRFKQFEVQHHRSLLKVGTDAVLLGALVRPDENVHHALDIGTGCGIIALMFAQRFKDAKIDAIEPDAGSYEEALQNFSGSSFSARLQAYQQTIQEFSAKNETRYELIFSNPPYFKVPDFKKGNNPIDISLNRKYASTQFTLDFNDLLHGAALLLSARGSFWVIIPYAEKQIFVDLAGKHNLFLIRQTLIRSKPGMPFIRCVLGFGKVQEHSIKEDEITLYTNDGARHEDYNLLSNEFYL